MKITDPDVIKNGEKDLIDAVKEDLDLDVIKQILEKKITASAMSSKGGQIIVHNNEIAFRLDFDLNLSGSLMFDRQGNYIPEADDNTDPEDEDVSSRELDIEDTEDNENISDQEISDAGFDLDDPLEEIADEFEDETAQNDMNDILKESQDFWDKKQDQ